MSKKIISMSQGEEFESSNNLPTVKHGGSGIMLRVGFDGSDISASLDGKMREEGKLFIFTSNLYLDDWNLAVGLMYTVPNNSVWN